MQVRVVALPIGRVYILLLQAPKPQSVHSTHIHIESTDLLVAVYTHTILRANSNWPFVHRLALAILGLFSIVLIDLASVCAPPRQRQRAIELHVLL